MYSRTCTYIKGSSPHWLVRAKDWKQAKCLLKEDWLINANTSDTTKEYAIVKKNEEAVSVLIRKGIQDKSLREKKQRKVQDFSMTTFYVEKRKEEYKFICIYISIKGILKRYP